MIEPKEKISIRQQCRLLDVTRSNYYYEPAGTSRDDLNLMKRIDEIHLKYPFYGSRRIAWLLSQSGPAVNRKRVQRLMRLIGIEAIAPKPKTSEPAPEHVVFPDLLRNPRIERVNMV